MTCDECAENYELGRSDQLLETEKYKNMLQICANIIDSNEDDLGNDLLKLNEDAKKLHGTEIMLKRCQELGLEDAKKLEYYKHLLGGKALTQILEDAKKWNEIEATHIRQAVKDRQIVKKLKEIDFDYLTSCLRVGINASWDKFKNNNKDTKEFLNLIEPIIELQKILKEKK